MLFNNWSIISQIIRLSVHKWLFLWSWKSISSCCIKTTIVNIVPSRCRILHALIYIAYNFHFRKFNFLNWIRIILFNKVLNILLLFSNIKYEFLISQLLFFIVILKLSKIFNSHALLIILLNLLFFAALLVFMIIMNSS